MARSARRRSPLRQTRSLFSSLREVQLPPMYGAPEESSSTSPRPHRHRTIRRPRKANSRTFDFSKMGGNNMQAETVDIDLMAMMEVSTMSADEQINTSAGSFSEEPNNKLFDSPPLSPTGPLSSSAPPGGPTLEQFLKQRRSKDQRRSASKKTAMKEEEEMSIASTDASIQSMDTLRVRAKKTSSSSSTRGQNKLPPKSSNSNKVISLEEATTSVFLQLCFMIGGSVNVRHHIGLPKARRDGDIVIMQDTAIISKETAKALRLPCPIGVGATNSAT